ncbi:MAG TPA: hypothetical protein VNS81_04565 [Nocardioides sp.]|nr:hypothetical protein [Nocardioides sp.]
MDLSLTLLSRQKCRWIAGTSLAVVVAGSPFVVPAAANAADTGDVSVHVVDHNTFRSVPGQSVQLFSTATGTAVGAAKTTDADGDVQFTGLNNGGYTAKVAGTSAYHEQYSRVVVLDDEDVNDGQSDSAFAFVGLTPATITQGRLSGSVTKAGADELSGDVFIFPSSATNASIQSGETQPVEHSYAYGYDDGKGEAQDDWATKLAPGSYKVLVTDRSTATTAHHDPTPDNQYDYYADWDERQSEVWVGSGASNDASHAKSFTVTAAKTTAVDTAVLAPATVEPPAPARISGTVTGTASAKLGDVQVRLFRQVDEPYGDGWQSVSSSYTGDDGTFRFDGTWDYNYETGEETFTPLAPGTYTLWFSDERGEYKSEFAGDKAGEYTYDDVPGDVQNITLGATGSVTNNATLAPAPLDTTSGLHGKVTNDLGAAHAGSVAIWDTYGNVVDVRQTRRDGNWTLPTTELAPGTYKIGADDDVDVSGFYGGGRSYKNAKTFTVPVKGATAAGNSNLLRYGSISGKISLAAGPGDATSIDVRLYDQDGDMVDGIDPTSTGAFTLEGTEPGTYYLSANGGRYSTFDDTEAQVSWLQYIKQFWKGKFTIGSATPITVGSGGNVTGINMTLGRTLAATSSPTIDAPKKVKKGSVLTATPGTWNVGHDVAFTYTWKRGSTVVGSGSSYKVVKADGGKVITLTVTATDVDKEFASGAATSAGVKVAKNKKKKK